MQQVYVMFFHNILATKTKALASRIKWVMEVITNEELSVNKELINMIIGIQKHGYYGLDSLYVTKGIIKTLNILSMITMHLTLGFQKKHEKKVILC